LTEVYTERRIGREKMGKKIRAVVLAGGLGTRMKSEVPKVLHSLSGKPMIQHVLDAVRSSGVEDIICVIGHRSEMVKKGLGGVETVVQKEPLGSGDALSRTRDLFKDYAGTVLVLCGDAPLVRSQTLQALMDVHAKEDNFCTLLTTTMTDPTGYGRIVRDDKNHIANIVEETEASIYDKAIEEINVGVYCFKAVDIFSILSEIKSDNKKGEYFLTDAIALMRGKGLKLGSVSTNDSSEAIGVNSREELSMAAKILQRRISAEFMQKGITIVDPETTYIDKDIEVGGDTVIYPHTIIEKDVKIGKDCKVGPFARIRPGCDLADEVEIGNFVELVRTKIGSRTKVKHHTYLGDAIVGKDVNVGAGTITANYDGKKKNITRIDDGSFIGVGAILIAPVKIGKRATVGAGAVVSKDHDVPPGKVVVGIPAKEMKGRKGARR
jgi:bifunctional UDP-N-acetylglucosamine pyrophosphorylase/glucosamine-1-phosphate N-acetyltransferase